MFPPGQQLAAPHKWPVVGERTPAEPPEVWTVSITGLVRQPITWTFDQLAALPQVERAIDIHCVTRWSKLGMLFRGVLLADALAAAEVLDGAEFLSFVAHSVRRHSTSLPLAEALRLEAIIALSADGQPISSEHGGPVRVIVPGKYFYKSVKWLREIRVLAEDELGFWEGKAGYHNEADPWREQRYVAPNLNRMQVAKAFTQRNFAGLEFQGLEAAGIELPNLNATAAVLRNVDFRRSKLAGAKFDRANLSNARFERADLRGASFVDADVEGADFTAADLRGCDFRGASLLGVTFFPASEAEETADVALLDATTRFQADQLQQLAPPQAEFVQRGVS